MIIFLETGGYKALPVTPQEFLAHGLAHGTPKKGLKYCIY